MVFLYFHDYLLTILSTYYYILTEGIKNMNEHIWNYVLNKKV